MIPNLNTKVNCNSILSRSQFSLAQQPVPKLCLFPNNSDASILNLLLQDRYLPSKGLPLADLTLE